MPELDSDLSTFYKFVKTDIFDFITDSCTSCADEIYRQKLINNGKYVCVPDSIEAPSAYRCLVGSTVDSIFDETMTGDRMTGRMELYNDEF